jgi:hypothetical protein
MMAMTRTKEMTKQSRRRRKLIFSMPGRGLLSVTSSCGTYAACTIGHFEVAEIYEGI